MVTRRTVLKGTAGAVGFSFTSGCVGQFGGGGPQNLKIGFMVPLSGQLSSYGLYMQPAVELAVDELNDDGGILGNEIGLITEDTQTDPDLTREAVKKLTTQDNVNCLMGPVSSTFSLANLDFLKSVDDPPLYLVAPSSSQEIAKKIRCEEITTGFHTSDNGLTKAVGMVEHALQELGSTFYYIGPDNDYGHAQADAYSQVIAETEGEVLGNSFYQRGTKDYASVLNNIDSSNAEVVINNTTGDDTWSFMNQRLDFGLTDIPILDNSNGLHPNTLEELNSLDAVDNVFSATIYRTSIDTERNRQFVENFKDRHPQGSAPTRWSQQLYDNVYYLNQGAERADSLDAQDIAPELAGSNVDSIVGELKIREEDHLLLVPLFILTLNDQGETEIIKQLSPEETAAPLLDC